MFSERISLVFKRLRVVRMVDATRNTLVYLTYSDRVIEGSPQNSVTAVPVDRARRRFRCGNPVPSGSGRATARARRG
jgi:catabolite regulation protein CreA